MNNHQKFKSYIMNPKELINWASLSRLLANDRSSITKSRVPKKHQEKINKLITLIGDWQESIKEEN